MKNRSRLIAVASCALVLSPLALSAPAVAASASTRAAAASSADADAEPSFQFAAFRLVSLDGETARVLVRGEGDRGQHLTVTDLTSGRSVTASVEVASTFVDVPVARGTVGRLVATVGDGATAATSSAISVDNTWTHLDAPDITTVTPTGRNSFSLVAETRPGAELLVRDARGRLIGQSAIHDGTGPSRVGATWNAGDPPSERRFTVLQRYGVTSEATPFLLSTASSGSSAIETPDVESVADEGGLTRIRVAAAQAPADGAVVVRDFFGTEVASSPVAGGRGEVAFRAVSGRSTYLVSVRGTALGVLDESRRVGVTVGSGSLVPAAPDVTGVVASGSKALASISGIPGALVTVRDASDRIVAVKRLPAGSATAQVVVPAAGDLAATQATGVIESDPAPLDVPSAVPEPSRRR
jgi:hypothetical protein